MSNGMAALMGFVVGSIFSAVMAVVVVLVTIAGMQ